MQLTEVSTLLTDYLLAAVTAALAVALWRCSRGRAAVAVHAIGFAAPAVSAAAGGTYHGFALELPAGTLAALRKVSTWAVGVFAFCIVTGKAMTCGRGSARLALAVAAGAALVAYLAWMLTHDEFRFVIYYTAFAILLLAALSLHARRSGAAGARWSLAGIAVSAAAAGVQYLRIAPHPSFNHNDLYHVVQAAAMYLFYRGALG